MSDPVLHVQMLGGFSLQLDAGPAPSKLSRSAASLLAFLLFHRDRPQTRDLLAGRFWSDQAEDKARRRLSNALWQVNRAWKEDPERAGIDLLATTATTVGINPRLTVSVDVEKFERRLDELERQARADRRFTGIDEVTELVGSYRGDLLSGHYDEWLEGPRKRLRDRYLSALDQLVDLARGRGDYETAIRHARTLVDMDPLREEWHRSVMRLWAMAGEPGEAEGQYEACRGALYEELGVPPSAETSDLIGQIRRDVAIGPVAVVESNTRRLPLIGRADERSALLGRLNDLVGGKGGVALVEGEAGIGKTRLMEEVMSGAEWRGVQVLTGGHSETSGLSPYEGLRAALGPATIGLRGEHLAANLQPVWLWQAGAVLPELRRIVEPVGSPALRPEEEPWRATEALAQVVLAQSRPKPTILILEDLHWCDEDTMAVLLQLGDRLIDSGVLVCVTYQLVEARRTGAIWQGLAELEAMAGSSRLVVPPLAEAEVRLLVGAELGPGRLSEPVIRRLVDSTAGNPSVILELLRNPGGVLDEQTFGQTFELSDQGSVGEQGTLAPRLAEILAHRVDATSDDVRIVLRAVAALAVPVSSRVVSAVVGLDRLVVLDALSEAMTQGFLVESAAGVTFESDQARRAVYERIPPADRPGLHSAILDGLNGAAGVGVEQLAHHAWQAGRWPEAHSHHVRAAEAALRVNAFQTTAEHYGKADRAAASAGVGDAGRVQELLAWERVLDTLGRRAEQQALIERLGALDDLPAELVLEVLQRRAWLLVQADKAAEAAELAASGVGPALAAGLGVGELYTIVGTALTWSGRQRDAIDPLERAVAAFDAVDESALPARLMLGRALADLGDLVGADRHLIEANDEATRRNDARSQVEALGNLAILHNQQGREVAAETAFRQAAELAREIGYRHGEGRNLVNLAAFYHDRGQAGRALTHLAEAGEVFASLGNGRGEAFVKYNASHVAHWFLGQDDLAWEQATEAATLFRSIGDERTEALCLNTLASIQRRRGRRRHAKRQLTEALAKSASREARATEGLTRLNLALVTIELGQLDEAADHIHQAKEVSRLEADDRLLPALNAIHARILAAEGRLDEAVVLVNQTIGLNRAGAELPHLVALWCAMVLDAAGLPAQVADQVALAHQLLETNLEEVSPVDARRARTEIPEHRAIGELRQRHFVDRVRVGVPRWEAPTGRPLEPADLLEIEWTVSEPADWDLPSAAARRRHRILRLADQARRQGGVARVSDLADALGVSERTIKRDLASLRSDGRNPVTRGSAEENS